MTHPAFSEWQNDIDTWTGEAQSLLDNLGLADTILLLGARRWPNGHEMKERDAISLSRAVTSELTERNLL